jgi:hypothetical protein
MNVLALALLLTSGVMPVSAFGQTLRDPTQPPSVSEATRPGEQGAPRASGPALQSIILSHGRKLALIDGRLYKPGDKMGDAMIVAISSGEVVLREHGETRTLKLYQDIQKTAAGPRAPKAPGRSKDIR